MKVHMIHDLMRNPAIVLQDIVVLDALCYGNLLRDGKYFGKLVVWDIVEFGAVVFGDDELEGVLVSGCLGDILAEQKKVEV